MKIRLILVGMFALSTVLSANPSFQSAKPVWLTGKEKERNLLAGFRGAGLLRVKGIVNVEGKPYAVQAVQTIVDEPVPLAAWPDDGRRSRLVFITRGIDAADIKRTFATFRFDAGRASRNLTLNPATYAQFAETMQLFRTSSGRTKELEPR